MTRDRPGPTGRARVSPAGRSGQGVLGQQQHPGRGLGRPDQPDQLADLWPRHLGPGHQHVGLVGEHRLQGRGAVAGHGNHLQVILGRQHHAEAFDERIVVVGQDDPYWLPHAAPR
jgi:hypothetical protein